MEAQAGAGDDAATIVMKDTRNNLLRTGYDSPIGRRVYLRNIQESSQSAAHTGTGTLVYSTAPSWCEIGGPRPLWSRQPLTRQDAGKRGNSRSPSRWLHPREVT